MGPTEYEDDEIYEDDEEQLSYEPPKPVTAEDVAGLEKLPSLAHVDDVLDGIDENIKLINHREYTRLRGERLLNLEKAHRAPRCQHVRLSGKACGSPAVSGQQYCHFHGLAKADLCFELPVIEDSRSFQIAVMRLCQQIAEERSNLLTPKSCCRLWNWRSTIFERAPLWALKRMNIRNRQVRDR